MARNPLSILYPAWHIVNYDSVPIFRAHAWALLDAHYHGQRFTVTSGDRRTGTIHWFNKTYHTNLHDQAYLYDGFARGLPGFYPANPPTRGTHLLLGDGVVGAVGSKLQDYELGIDVVSAGRVNDAGPLVAWLNRSGYSVTRPYSAGSEAHHILFRKSPAANARKRLANYYRLKR